MTFDGLNLEHPVRKQRMALLVSGSGSNAERIMERFQDHPNATVAFVGCNRPPEKAGIYQRTKQFGLTTTQFNREQLNQGEVTQMLQEAEVDWVVLAGFLLRIPLEMVEVFNGRMVNIHPALLPKFGGKGMFNNHVHEAVALSKETETGMTVHWVNAEYDDGDILFQASCPVELGDTAETIGARVLALEHRYYADVVESLIRESTDEWG
jgi:phosphoribosylglycinamide formyltransferase-1